MRSNFLVSFGACSIAVAAAQYTVTVINQPTNPVISHRGEGGATYSAWPQSFNPAYVFPSAGTAYVEGLLVRSQNCSMAPFVPGQCIGCNVDSNWPLGPYFPGSVITFAALLSDGSFAEPYLVFAPEADAPQDETNGTEDPRLAYDASTGLYHLFYTAYGVKGPFLAHATSFDPTAPYPTGNWQRLGAVFPKNPGSKSGALLIRPSPPHYMYWGAGVIALATSDDLLNFTTINASFITKRDNFFDNNLVEAGPSPLQLLDGNYIFFHNSDNTTSTSGGDFGSYNPGFVILDGNDPTQIVQRSSFPLLTPQFGWEQGVAPFACNVHNVTFLEAARRVPGASGDVFDVWFGGSDTVVGTARIQVTKQ